MIDSIIQFSIKNKLIVGLMTLALIAGGLFAMKEVPLDAVPDITNNQVQVITTAPNLGTEDIEQFVTYPVELAMANLPGVNEIRSVSRFGLSVVTIVFEDEMGTYLPRQLVDEKLQEVRKEIPEGFGDTFVGPISTGLGEIYQYSLEIEDKFKDKYSLQELRTIQDWIVKRQLAMVPGVVEVNSLGGKIKQYEVAIEPERLRSMDLTLLDVLEALKQNNQNTGGAYIEKNRQANFIRGEGLVSSAEEIEQIVVRSREGLPVLIKDIAEVRIGSAVRYGAFTRDGEEAVGGLVLMLKNANSNEVVQAVKSRMARIGKSLPEGVSIKAFHDRSELIQRTTSTVSTNLLEGGLIVIFVLVLLLGNWRGGLIVASTIPLSLLFAFILMWYFDVWANLMSLGAIDFGIIVDGAVIIVESVVFAVTASIYRKKKVDQQTMDKVSFKSSSSMMNSAFFGQLIILIVFAPILALEGVEGKMFRPMAMTFGFAILGAMLLCLTYVPMMSALLIRPVSAKASVIGDKTVGFLSRIYDPIIRWALRKSKLVAVIALVLLAGSGWVFSRLGGEFIPQLEEGDLAIQAVLKPGSALSQTIDATEKIENKLLKTFPDELESVYARIGVSEIPTDPMPMDIADMYIKVKPQEEWSKAENPQELVEQMEEVLSTMPGISMEFSQPIELRFNELLTGIRQDLAIKLYGPDMDILSAKAQEITSLIQGIEGIGDMRAEATMGLPVMSVRYERAKLAQYGLDVQTINTFISSAFAGKSAGLVFEKEKRFDLVIRMSEDYRQNIGNLRNLYIPLESGQQIPLKEVAQVSFQPAPMQISRENTNRRTYVGINVRGRDVESLVGEISQVLDEKLKLPPGYFIEYGGSFENLQRAKDRLSIVVPIALALVFVLVFFALRSFVQSIMIYLSIPFAAIGGIFSLWARDMPFSISAGVGFVVLFGVAVLNGLVLISSLNELKEEGEGDLFQRILKGAKRRIRPILLTASTDILGFLPMAISSSAGAEVQRPLATVVIGGMLTSTLLTLVVLPVFYQWVERRQEKKQASITKKMMVLLPLLVVSLGAQAQEADRSVKRVDLQQAVVEARTNYPQIQRAYRQADSQEELRKTALDLGLTGVGYEQEGFTEEFGDTPLRGPFLEQSLDVLTMPSKYKFRDRQYEQAKVAVSLTELQVERAVRRAWYRAAYVKKKYQVARELDSLYKDFERAAQLRYETEETSRLALLMAQSREREVDLLLRQTRKEYQQALIQLKKWMYSKDSVLIQGDIAGLEKWTTSRLPADSLKRHPVLVLPQKQFEVSKAAVKVEKAQFLPKPFFAVGANRIDENTFFHYRIGVGIPLWFVPQKGRLNAAKMQREASLHALNQRNIEVETMYQDALREYEKQTELLENYRQTLMPLSREQAAAAQLAYREGAMDYTTYVVTIQQSYDIQFAYLESLLNYYVAVNELQYFSEYTF
jgi:heavy metal efflux system protein